MMFILRRFSTLLLCVTFLLAASYSFAAEDGMGFQKKIEGKYVTVYVSPGLDASGLAEQLDIRVSDDILAGRLAGSRRSGEVALAQMLDTLFLQVSNILDMHIYSMKMDIKIGKTSAELGEVYSSLFGTSLGGRKSFYVYDTNTIYVSEEAFLPGIIGHEMSHAIISRYFGIPAPVKIQEVLSMYVEYNLKK